LTHTIVALASGGGPAPGAIVRLSGPDARSVAATCFRPAAALRDTDRRRALGGELELPGAPRPFPATAYVFLEPRSYTGQDLVELHLPGAPALIEATLQTLLAAAGDRVRPAHPGEFTRRAVECGRIDLARAEAVAALVQATGHDELVAARRTLGGGLSRQVTAAREAILDLLVHLEAELDFVEDEIDLLPEADLAAQLARLAARLEAVAACCHTRATGRADPLVVLLGPANAGKSSLFNALLGELAATVDDVPGTTLDRNERVLAGPAGCLRLADLAGVGEPTTPLEVQAQALVREVLAGADHVLLVRSLDPADPAGVGVAVPAETPVTRVDTKADVAGPGEPPAGGFRVSAITGEGVAVLRQHLLDCLAAGDLRGGGAELVAGVHTADRLERARQALHGARQALPAGRELAAQELHLAADELAALLGRHVPGEILDRIFSRFCIGK
jgi:tRNA modification GTPase